ncbi:MAG: folylpolyglutamate synthase/dihydrofolate synthase family protein [Vicinamibacterales bacterium]
MLDRLLALEHFGIKLGLENISHLCDALGHPERSFASIHVAGTNGKGSVTAMVHEGLTAAGLRTARFTSPHLVSLTERFVTGREPVTDDELSAVAADVLDVAERLRRDGILRALPTFFEATTAIAFELFRRARTEVAVVEVGLGGRFDATNVLEPLVTAVTSIGLDHREHLGDSLADIAFEKAGTIKPGVPVVTGVLPAEAAAVVARIAEARGAPLVEARSGSSVSSREVDGRPVITIETPGGCYGPIPLALRGAHQVRNALVAVRILETSAAAGLPVGATAVVQALRDTRWPARLELWQSGAARVLLDAAHNPDGAAALADHLARWHPERPVLVIAVMRDKDVEGILAPLLPVVSAVVATTSGGSRGLSPDRLATHAKAIAPQLRVLTAADPLGALALARELGPSVCVAGSIYLAGAVRGALEGHAKLL